MTTYEHSVSTGVLILALLLAVLAGGFSAWRFLPRNVGNIVLGVLYLAVLGLLAWCLLLPGRKDAVTQLLKPRFVIALDTSKSMTLSPTEETANRWTVAAQALKQPWVQGVAAECEVEVVAFGTGVGEGVPLEQAAKLQPEDAATMLRDGLRQVAERYAGLNVAGALLLSDGIDTREAFDDWAADKRPFPIYTVRLEPPDLWQKEADLRVDAVTTAQRVTVGWKTEFKVKVSGQGTRGNPVTVQVFKGDDLLAEKPTKIADEGGERVLVFEFEHPEIGTFDFRAVVPPLPDEANKEDNEYTVTIQVVDARNRLLYVEGTPRWDYKFLRRALLADKQVSPIVFYTGPDGSPHGGGGDITADMSPPELSQCKIVVLGDLSATELGAQRASNLVEFIEKGGSLVILGGRKAWGEDGVFKTALGKILPVRGTALTAQVAKEPFPVRLTDAARSHPAFGGAEEFWEVVPPVLSAFSGVTLSPGAQTLVHVETPQGARPLVATQRYGQGKVAVILTDSLWRWQLGPEAAKKQPYQRFWTQMISWLLPQEEDLGANTVDLFADRDQVFFGEEVELYARTGGDDRAGKVDCRITSPDGRDAPFQMTKGDVTTPSGKTFSGFSLKFTPEVAGAYKAVASAEIDGTNVTSEPITFQVQPFSPETRPRPINAKVLEAVAAASGGKFFQNLAELNQGLSGIDAHAIEEESAEFYTLWRTWPLVAGMMLVLAASWGLRKFRNMP